MVTYILLFIIYVSFISLGLPDSIIGSAWPVASLELNLPDSSAGIIYFVASLGTVLSSILSEKVLKKLGTGLVAFLSTLLTAIAIYGVSKSNSLIFFLIFAIPLGIGAGSIDAGLNNYVAVNYKAHHMSWLHCFWGIGATISPIIISFFIKKNNWRGGFSFISFIQFSLSIVLFLSLSLWRKNKSIKENGNEISISKKSYDENMPWYKIPGVIFALFVFLFYSGIEASVGLWGSTFLVNIKNIDPATAARWVSMFFAGITVGRFLSGFLVFKFSSKQLITLGQIIILIGVIFLLLPLPNIMSLVGLILIGFGCAPIFPSMIHETPANFGETHSQAVMGYQMAFAYVGGSILPPTLGFLSEIFTIKILPILLLAYIILMFIFSSKINSVVNVEDSKNQVAKK